jgi:hypothetical protein
MSESGLFLRLEKLLRNELCPKDEIAKNRLEQLTDRITNLGKEAKKE